MSANTSIEWCDATVNFWSGCTKVSPGCANCYAEKLARINRHYGKWGTGAPRAYHKGAAAMIRRLNRKASDRVCSNGHGYPATYANLLHGKCYQCGERWEHMPHRRPRIFINSMSDWLDHEVPIQYLAAMLDSIRLAPNVDFLLLTKRPQNFDDRMSDALPHCDTDTRYWLADWSRDNPPHNVWIGTTVEDQQRAAERIPHLLGIPAALRFLSCEPLLGPVDLNALFGEMEFHHDYCVEVTSPTTPHGIHWLICGGESGPHARPMHPDWPRDLRDQCQAAKIPFFFKQWGEWAHMPERAHFKESFKEEWTRVPGGHLPALMFKIGKQAAGRTLDGHKWNEFPQGGAS